MEEIIRFVMLARSERFTMTELCEQFGISQKTGYKYLERHAADGLRGLQLRGHRPHLSPQRTDAAIRGTSVLPPDNETGRASTTMKLSELYRTASALAVYASCRHC
jgi:hypothetical protein